MAVEDQLPLALWTVPVAEYGGVARHIHDVAKTGLPGFRLAVLLPQGELSARLRATEATVLTTPFGTEAGFSTSFSTLNRVIAELRPAVVHSHLAYADIVTAAVVMARRALRHLKTGVHVPLLASTEHGIAGESSIYHGSAVKAQTRNLTHRLRLRATDISLAVSASTAEQMRRRWHAQQVKIVPNGIEVQHIADGVRSHHRASAGSGPRILSLARLAPEKGLNLLLEAFVKVREIYPEARLELAGSGPLEGDLKMRVRSLGLGESVVFSGFVDPLVAMGRNDFVVQLSRWENLSYTLLDAKAVPLRAVATDVGGNREILAAQELVAVPQEPGKDTASEVAHRIMELWRKPVIAGKPAHTVEQMVQEIVCCYQRENK